MYRTCFALVLVMVMFLSVGCRVTPLTEEEKQKISQMESDIKDLELEIATVEKNLSNEDAKVLYALMRTRMEVDRLTVSILKQHIESIKSGVKTTIVIEKIQPRPELLPDIEKEMKDNEVEIRLAEKDSKKLAGHMAQVLAKTRLETEKLLYAKLHEKYLQYKYGLNVPILPQEDIKAVKMPGEEKKENLPDSAPVASAEEKKGPEINDPGPFDIRKVRFGMTREEVGKREANTEIFVEDKRGPLYKDKLLNKDVVLAYLFTDTDKLWRAAYILNEKHSNNNLYVDDYRELFSSLREKYGVPKEEKTIWSKDLYKGDSDNIGMAYAVGHVLSYAEWVIDGTSIYIDISGDNYKINIRIMYTDEELEKEHLEEEKKKASGNL